MTAFDGPRRKIGELKFEDVYGYSKLVWAHLDFLGSQYKKQGLGRAGAQLVSSGKAAICDKLLGPSRRQQKFDFLVGRPSLKTGRIPRLPVDAFYPSKKLVIELS